MSAARRAETGAPAPGEDPGARSGTQRAHHAHVPHVRLHPAKRVVLGVAGTALVLVGAALLVLPGPGLLLVLAGLILLSRAVPAVARFVAPVRDRAMQAAEAGVASRRRIACSVLAGLGLVAAGVVWGARLLPRLPLAGWSTGSSLILSGAVLFALLVWSYRRFRGPASG